MKNVNSFYISNDRDSDNHRGEHSKVIESILEELEKAESLFYYGFDYEDVFIIVNRLVSDVFVLLVDDKIAILADPDFNDLDDEELRFDVAVMLAKMLQTDRSFVGEYDD